MQKKPLKPNKIKALELSGSKGTYVKKKASDKKETWMIKEEKDRKTG